MFFINVYFAFITNVQNIWILTGPEEYDFGPLALNIVLSDIKQKYSNAMTGKKRNLLI